MTAIATSAAYRVRADGTTECVARITVQPHPLGHVLVLEGPSRHHEWVYTDPVRHVMRDYRRAVLKAAADPECVPKGRPHVWDHTDVTGVPVNPTPRTNPFAGLNLWRPE